MRRSQRLIAAVVLLGLTSALGACTSAISSWDPTDLFDFLDTKKKLPGDRQPVFPEGVPGLEQGVPKELYKDQVERQQQQDATQAAATAAPSPAPKSKQAKAGKGKPPPDSAAAADGEVQQAATPAAPPAPKRKKLVHNRTTPPPADSSAAQSDQPAQPAPAVQPAPAAQSAQQTPPPFPAPLPSGSFTR